MSSAIKKNPVLLLNVATSFGEVDWILPVLIAFKKMKPEWQIITIFGHQVIYQTLKNNAFLFEEFSKVCKISTVHTDFEQLFHNVINPEQVKIILKDFNPDAGSPFKTIITDRCPNALIVSFPHSNYIYSRCDTDPLKETTNPNDYSLHDIFLLSSKNDIPSWSNRVDREKIRTFGYPAYDPWWIDTLLKSNQFLQSKEIELSNHAKKVFFYISRGPHPHYLSQHDYEYIVRSVAEATLQVDDSFLLIKTHPRENIEFLHELLKPFDTNRWMLSGLHLTQLSYLSNMVISSWSSGILNALSVNKAVIEFFKFGNNNPDWRIAPDGSKTSIYRELGLAIPANTAEELDHLIHDFYNGKTNHLEYQQKAFSKHCGFNSNASQDIVECLLAEAQKKEKKEQEIKNCSEFQSLLHHQIEQGEQLAENQPLEKTLEYYEILDCLNPCNPRILNNLGVLKHASGDINAAVEYFSRSLRYNPYSMDTAIDLIDLLLVDNKTEKAMEVAIDFVSDQSNPYKHQMMEQLRLKTFDQEQISKINQYL